LLRAARRAEGWTQETLAARAGVAQETISALERGTRAGTPALRAAIARALGRAVADIWKDAAA
jgi:transcriptional regulator with XRE-family HTH domain